MKHILSLAAAAFLALSLPARADGMKFQVGAEDYDYQYREPTNAKLQGNSFGAHAAASYGFGQFFFATLDGRADIGHLSYSSNGTGSLGGTHDYTGEARFLLGLDAPVDQGINFVPYFGLGYRELYDNKGDEITDTGYSSYSRRARYLYAPVGVSFDFLAGDWTIRPNAEYDFLLEGFQTSYLSDLGAEANLENRQHSGYGARGSLMFVPPLFSSAFSIGPFVRYWDIKNSTTRTIAVFSDATLVQLEPNNTTLEAGIQADLTF